jgi:3-deoxy-alpha-D-manno-octulosonate 8-oxidase
MTVFRVFKQVPRIIFGKGSLARLSELLPEKKDADDYYVYVVDAAFRPLGILSDASFVEPETDVIEWYPASVKEPSTLQVDDLKSRILSTKKREPLAIIGIGGGSTMDVGKALSVMFRNAGSASLYQGWDLVPNAGVYKIGVPTISGSGAEASRTAVLMGKDRKFGINSDHSMFDAIVLDSSLIATVPMEQRFYTGMDCYIHCVESIQGTMINELARGCASKALELCEHVFLGDGNDDELMVASYFGGVSIVNSEVGVCHALSYGLSLELGLRHGLANCIAFNVLDAYYGPCVDRFRAMMMRHKISLPEHVCRNLDAATMDRMIDMTQRMERPLINALGEDWRNKLTRDVIRDLYQRM